MTTQIGDILLNLTDRMFVFVCLSIGFLFVGCSPNYQESSDPVKSQSADRIMHNADIEISQAGKPSGHLKADSLLFFDKEDRIFGYNITVDFFDTDGELSGNLSADSGWIENKNQRITVYSNVYVVTREDVRMWTDSLAYYPELSRIRTSAGVKIDKDGEYITGEGLDSDLEFTDIRITNNVSGRLKQD
ncbi:LPS export ABC transporter periplasmic protein LptC [bacterium]|nr:LPS export ABC transporter periplasmic protein LptC [bacterium]